MSTKNLAISEFEKRVIEENYVRIFKCLSMLDDTSIWFSPNGNIPSIGNLILHLSGNCRQWILSGLGDHEDNRERDEEFKVHKNIRKSDLIFLMENVKTNMRHVLKDLKDSDMEKMRTIQGFQLTGFSVLMHVMEHFSYHTGQITTLTKIITNKSTGYYTEFDVSKN
jgi:uncharacterized damage-inducible protein DinB